MDQLVTETRRRNADSRLATTRSSTPQPATSSRAFGKITTAASSASGTLYIGTSTGRIFAAK
jgi:hypothetical protein